MANYHLIYSYPLNKIRLLFMITTLMSFQMLHKMNSALEGLSCKKKTLFSVVHIFIYVGKIYGLAPYSFSASNNTQKCNSLLNIVTNTLIFLGKLLTCKFRVLSSKNLLQVYQLLQFSVTQLLSAKKQQTNQNCTSYTS